MRDTGIVIMLDTNCINARQADVAINQLEKWSEDGVIDIIMCETSHREASAGGSAARFRKAEQYVFSETAADTDQEQHQFVAIEQLLFPGGADTQGKRNDVDIVFNALKYGRTLVTNDGGSRRQPGGILGCADALNRLGVQVKRPEQVVLQVRARVNLVKDQVRKVCAIRGIAAPPWTQD